MFIDAKLHILYKKDIAEWFVYLDQQKFGRKLEKQMMAEIKRHVAGKETIDELVERVFKKPKTKWIVDFVEEIPKNYVFKSALGYA